MCIVQWPGRVPLAHTRTLPILTLGRVHCLCATTVAKLSGQVWHDRDFNGTQDDANRTLSGVLVRLLDSATQEEVANTTTDSAGTYTFTNLENGTYIVQVVKPTDLPWLFTKQVRHEFPRC